VLLKEGKPNQFLQTLWKNIPKQKKQEVSVKDVNINLAKLLPTKQGYYSFAGSLTTPPCSEEVTWMVLSTPVEMSKTQIAKFGSYYSNNARPVQPLNNRSLKVSKWYFAQKTSAQSCIKKPPACRRFFVVRARCHALIVPIFMAIPAHPCWTMSLPNAPCICCAAFSPVQ